MKKQSRAALISLTSRRLRLGFDRDSEARCSADYSIPCVPHRSVDAAGARLTISRNWLPSSQCPMAGMVSCNKQRRPPARSNGLRRWGMALAMVGLTLGHEGPSHAADKASFVGASTCAECHAAETGLWRNSHHALAMQKATSATVLGDFSDATFEHFGVTTTFSRSGDTFMVRTDGPDGALHDYQIAYTFGVYPLQQYLIEFPDGRVQALSVAWDTRPRREGGQRWFHLYPNEAILHDDLLHWTGPYQNWNFSCAECHSTDVHKNYDAAKDSFQTTWSEINVACETCHGAGSRHVAWARHENADTDKGLAVAFRERAAAAWTIDPKTGNARRSELQPLRTELETCGRCHS